ncbi:uncharacterized protein PAC_16612 [Phialocephala subalpina]|uniref:Heterokaryon incompatibility domain-containing protein n=1 Tax=Phialocephala subalpina TaxID=576137 RepID=A0A1L7XNS6_9HELO|nr:uncharacterized protein PAC_16612 [Phialocephala subalpina]
MSTNSYLTNISGGLLCVCCRSIFSVPLEGEGYGNTSFQAFYKTEITTQDIVEGAGALCTICRDLFQKFSNHEAFKCVQPLQVCYNLRAFTKIGFYVVLEVLLKAKEDNGGASLANMHWKLEQLVDAGDRHSKPVTSMSTGSPETFEFVQRNLKICDERHRICAASRPKENWYPTRLIDLGSRDHESSTAKLVITSQCQISGQYVSLSHRWGDGNFLKLTSETLPQLMDAIEISTYPNSKTFADAFGVTRALGIRYIWVDSLCIIQDSPEDWLCESNMMLMVYKHAYCNIAATHAESNAGLFRSRNPITWSTDLQLTAYGPISGTFRLLKSHQWQEEIDNAPLNRRGWVVQERHISSRIVNFASEQVFWDCYELEACETDLRGVFLRYDENISIPKASKRYQGPLETLRTDLQFLNKWAVIVHQYSTSELSFPEKDKIIAISSIAQHLQETWQIEYCAGLWRKPVLELQLYWTTPVKNCASTSRKRPRTLRAPSWSWLSYDGSVVVNKELYQFVHYLALARVMDVRLQQSISASDDLILLGYLELRCILYPLILNHETKRYQAADPALRDPDYKIHTVFDYCDDLPGSIFFVPLYRNPSYYDKISFLLHGILVRPSEQPNSSFMRCGTCRVVLKSPGLNAASKKEKFHVDFNETDGCLIRLY